MRTCSLDQPFLLRPSLQDWLPEKDLARFNAEVVDSLDLRTIYSVYERKDNRGVVAYHPLMLTRLLLYGDAIGLTSSRRIEKATYDDLAFPFLAADQHPDHDTIANFRQQHLDSLAKLFVQTLQLCRKAWLVKLGNVAIDGSKSKANASWHRGTTYNKLSEAKQRLEEVERVFQPRKRGRKPKGEDPSDESDRADHRKFLDRRLGGILAFKVAENHPEIRPVALFAIVHPDVLIGREIFPPEQPVGLAAKRYLSDRLLPDGEFCIPEFRAEAAPRRFCNKLLGPSPYPIPEKEEPHCDHEPNEIASPQCSEPRHELPCDSVQNGG